MSSCNVDGRGRFRSIRRRSKGRPVGYRRGSRRERPRHFLIEPDHDFRTLDEDRPSKQIRLLQDERDRFGFRGSLRLEPPFLVSFVPGVQEEGHVPRAKQLVQFLPRERRLDVVSFNRVDPLASQETSRVATGDSGAFPVERHISHGVLLPEIGRFFKTPNEAPSDGNSGDSIPISTPNDFQQREIRIS